MDSDVFSVALLAPRSMQADAAQAAASMAAWHHSAHIRSGTVLCATLHALEATNPERAGSWRTRRGARGPCAASQPLLPWAPQRPAM